jgi:signal transduction histidine kinase
MKRVLGIPRRWLGSAMVVILAALLTVPWTFWVVFTAYQRNVMQKTERLAERVRLHLANYRPEPWVPETGAAVLDPLKTELLGDNTVQAVCFLDFVRNRGGAVRRSESIPVPTSREHAHQLLNQDPASYRYYAELRGPQGVMGIIYIDLSRRQLLDNFWIQERDLLWRVGISTVVATLLLGTAGAVAFNIWRASLYQRQRAELEQAGARAERGLTAAVLAHEIRNPLQALRFHLHNLRHAAGDVAQVNATADTIDAELGRIQGLVQDYLAHERAQALRPVPVSLRQAVEGVQTLLGEMLRQAGTRLVVPAHEDVVVRCDPHALRQILLNLVLNAHQAMSQAPVREPGQITIRLGREGGFGVVAVSDTGPGIPPEMRPRIFKPFATSKKEGSGIGLALVKRFADNFSGQVSFETEMGRGTTFHLRLPLA